MPSRQAPRISVLAAVAEPCALRHPAPSCALGLSPAFAALLAREDSESTRTPLWAREALYHVLWRAQNRTQHRRRAYEEKLCDAATLKSIGTLLSLVKRHKPSPPADPQFFQWAQRVVREHQKSSDAVELVTVVSQLVPFLPEHQRSGLAQLVMTPKSQPAEPVMPSTSEPSERRRFLDTASAGRVSSAPVVLSSLEVRSSSTSSSRSGDRLWGMLSAVSTPSEPLEPVQPKSRAISALLSASQFSAVFSIGLPGRPGSTQHIVGAAIRGTPSLPWETKAARGVLTSENTFTECRSTWVPSLYHRLPRRIEEDYKTHDVVLGSGYNGVVQLATYVTDDRYRFAVKAFKIGNLKREKKAWTQNLQHRIYIDHH
eukprot:Skav213649  [mRNA]  locus=scaffold2012:280012:289087:+ [translate_table: standard]